MLLPLLIPIVSAVAPILIPRLVDRAIPKLVVQAEQINGPGEMKMGWVLGFFDDLEKILVARDLVSPRVLAVWAAVKPTLVARIEIALVRLKSKGVIPTKADA